MSAAYFCLCVVCAVLLAYTMRWQGATLYRGRKVTPNYPLLPAGSQDAITPPSQGAKFIALCLTMLAVLILGVVLFRWYMALAAVLATSFGAALVGAIFMPAYDSPYFRKRIRANMSLRCQRYHESGDKLRAELMRELIEKLDHVSS